MKPESLLSKLLAPLLVGAVALSICLAVLLAVGGVLQQTGDMTGAQVLGCVALAIGIFWIVDLIGLLIVLAIFALVVNGQTGSTEFGHNRHKTDRSIDDSSYRSSPNDEESGI
jgi:uncharacterized membrane protein